MFACDRIVIKLDMREHALIAHIQEATKIKMNQSQEPIAHIEVEVEPLDVGDVQIWLGGTNGERVPWMVYERKTSSDLLASLNSGRYHEQQERLKAWIQTVKAKGLCEEGEEGEGEGKVKGKGKGDGEGGGEGGGEGARARPQLLYLLEGLDESNNRLMSCMNAMIAVHRLHVVRTRSVEDSSHHIAGIARTLYRRAAKNALDITAAAAGEGGRPDRRETAMCSAVAYQKRSNVTTQTQCWTRQLCCVPGIASTTAKKIVDKIPTMQALVDIIRADGPERRIMELVPGIGPKLASTLVAYLTAG